MPLYSDIVASRLPSPRKENEQGGSIVGNIESADHSDGGVLERNDIIPDVVANTTSSGEGEQLNPDKNECPWTTVERRCAHSYSPQGKRKKESL